MLSNSSTPGYGSEAGQVGSSASLPPRPVNLETAEATFSETYGPEGRTLELVFSVRGEGQDRRLRLAEARQRIDAVIGQDESAYSGVVIDYLDMIGLVWFRGSPCQADLLTRALQGEPFFSGFQDRTGRTVEAISASSTR